MASGFLGRLRALLRSVEVATPAAARTIFVEEDDWGQVEVLPAAATDWCRAELDRIAAFSDKHRAPGGAGWTDIYVRKPAPISLADLRIPLASTLDVLGQRLSRFDIVTSGSFYSPEPVTGACAFGSSPKTALIVIGDKDEKIVRSILLVADEDHSAARLMAALGSLPSRGGLIVVDWLRGELIPIQPSGGG